VNEKEVQDGLQKMDMSGEMWIGVKDTNLYRLMGSIAINNPSEKSTGTISIDLTFDPNKTVSIQAPTGAKDLIEEAGKILGPMMMVP